MKQLLLGISTAGPVTSRKRLTEPAFGGKWQFSRTRGTVVVLHRLQITTLLGELLTELRDAGRGKQLVTQAWSCSTHVLYLTKVSTLTDRRGFWKRRSPWVYSITGLQPSRTLCNYDRRGGGEIRFKGRLRLSGRSRRIHVSPMMPEYDIVSEIGRAHV